MMGAGKTTTGRLVAEKLGWDYLDEDFAVRPKSRYFQVCINGGSHQKGR